MKAINFWICLIIISYISYHIKNSQLMSKSHLLLLCLAVFALGFKLEIEEIEDASTQLSARLPAYLGAGYHALKGNPYTNRIDQGFKAQIFAHTYNQGLTTEDGLFQIPDFTQSTQTVACSMNSKVKEYSGTQNYQKQLSNIVTFDARFDGLVMSAKFSFSYAYSSFSNNTVSKKLTSSQTNAECTLYTLQMPIYSNELTLSNDFINGVKQSFASNQWEEFLDHFGSHYATSVTFGGRYFTEHTYTEQSISLFKSMKLDLSIAAQFQFFSMAGMSLTEDLKKYANQTKVINTKVETSSIASVGGLPPASGNWIDWVNTVRGNLAPVSYRFAAITVLFNYVPGIDAAGAIQSFSDFFNSYCRRNVCPPVVPDRPDPKPLDVVITQGAEIQGKAISTIKFDMNDGQITAGMRIYRIAMGFVGNLESIQFILSDGITQHALPHVGTNTAMSKTYTVPDGDELKCIRFGVHIAQNATNYQRFSTIQFTTRGGSESETYKGNLAATSLQVVCVDNGDDHIVGFHGRTNSSGFDSIGLNIAKWVLRP